jgi:hypothetical protein
MMERAPYKGRGPDLDGQSIPGAQVCASGATPAAAFVYPSKMFHDRYGTEPAEAVLDADTTALAAVLPNEYVNAWDPGISYDKIFGHMWDTQVQAVRFVSVIDQLSALQK